MDKNINFSLFKKPSRYINNEINHIRHTTKPLNIKMALAFPDVYEIGMSHLGLKILYDIINQLPFACAERVFYPWTDLENYIKKNNILLSSLETNTPLKDFDIVGFSLQYELSYPTVLHMLSLSQIPIRSEERLNTKAQLPFIIAGGPCTVNPHPMSLFTDAFVIGEAEDVIIEILNILNRWKIERSNNRQEVLYELSKLQGLYIPIIHNNKVTRIFIKDLDKSPYPIKPIVPYMSIVHDRINIEIGRGCSMGCRFCQSGIIYRPVRQRSPETILKIAENSIRHTGYEELSFSSLSAGDYPHLLPLLKEFNRRFCNTNTAISLPSLRVASVNKDMLKEIKSERKTGFTIAPEAATQRLRNVINKNFTEDDYESALKSLFEEGWLNIKLYFMIGLPTEQDKDVQEIEYMVMKTLKIAKRNTNKFVNINVTISPFIPKPHTPFQWCGQVNIDEMKRKTRFLKERLQKKNIKYKGHNEEMILLEAGLARGGKGMSNLIEQAWLYGCKLDAWSEAFDYSKWTMAMDKSGLDIQLHAEKTFALSEPLPWDNINVGVNKDFLMRQYNEAVKENKTLDCTYICLNCGIDCKDKQNYIKQLNIIPKEITISAINKDEEKRMKLRYRVQFSKTGYMKYLSHLEIITTISRALKRARIPVIFSQGFHPKPEISFGPPLRVGIKGEEEYFDINIKGLFDIQTFKENMNQVLPSGIQINKVSIIPSTEISLDNFINRYEYRIKTDCKQWLKYFNKISNGYFLVKSSIIIQRDIESIDISKNIENLKIIRDEIILILLDIKNQKAHLKEIVEILFAKDINDLDITRIGLYGYKGKWEKPIW